MEHFDVCLIAFADVSTDARTLNISRTLAKNNLKVAIIGIGTNDIIKNDIYHSITFYNIAINPNNKTWQRWLDFYRKSSIVAYDINARFILAEDAYCLAVAAEMKNKNKSVLIYDSREIYSAIASLSGRKMKQRFLSFFERRFIRKVDKIVVTGEMDAEYLKQNLTDKKPYYIIRNLPPYREHQKSDKLRNHFNIPDDSIIIVYQGMLLKGRGLEKSVKSMIGSTKKSFVMLGDGPLRPNLEELIKFNNLEDRVFLAGAIHYDELHEWTCSADVGLSLIEPISKSYELALPNKLFEYIMAGIPVVCSELPAMAEIIDKYKIGKHIPIDATEKAITDAIDDIVSNKGFYKNNCLNASKELRFDKQESIVMELVN